MRFNERWPVAIAALWLAGAAAAQDADLTILVDGALLEHGGVVEVTAVPAENVSVTPQTVTLTDRYVQLQILYPKDESYNFRFRPVPEAMARERMDLFATQPLSVGGRTVDAPDGPKDGDWQSIRVLPFAEYGSPEEVERTDAAWGVTQLFADVPPANHWGARALPWVFDTFGERRTVGLVCKDEQSVSVCVPDPKDALLMEALWWRAIAEGRLERLQHDALRRCYDSGGLFRQPKRCEGEAGDGWPSYRPAD